MANRVELRIDVSNAVDFGEAAHVAVSVVLPDPASLPSPTVVCFAKPGGGYSRGYYTHELPGPPLAAGRPGALTPPLAASARSRPAGAVLRERSRDRSRTRRARVGSRNTRPTTSRA